jgi:mRNA-degrading endonuclease RelE of RelBE toxin-antitoxin system
MARGLSDLQKQILTIISDKGKEIVLSINDTRERSKVLSINDTGTCKVIN